MILVLLSGLGTNLAAETNPGFTPESDKNDSLEAALRMIRASQNRLAPVYEPLAKHLAKELKLTEKNGIGIDIGSGPGALILELCKRTELHWINADINPHFFSYFMRQASANKLTGRVSAIQADVHALPFRDGLADVIVSRGSFWLWQDKPKAFKEILRVLKPGGVAYIGRGFSENLPLEAAQRIRKQGGGRIKYDVNETVAELNQIMHSLKIHDFHIIRPRPDNEAGINYGVWVKFTKQG